MGSKDMLCRVAAILNTGWEDTLAHFIVAASFKKMLAFQLCGIKQSSGSSGQARASGSPQGLEDTLAYVTVEEFASGFMLGFQRSGIKQNRGAWGEGI